jgi:hypothetical protein
MGPEGDDRGPTQRAIAAATDGDASQAGERHLAKVNPKMNDPEVQVWSQAKAEEMFADMERRGSDVPDLMGALNAH